MRSRIRALALAGTALLALAWAAPAMAQDSDAEIIVTARRIEERLQDVPASITVFNQQQLDNLNTTNLADLGRYTPGLFANNRFGDDNSSFAIRGFTQELRTTASVGVFFADVVAPRGGGAITGGDGAGPGSVFDLQNVQILRGPQGTLFGRNTTGGAVLLVPRRPTDALEGYAEGSMGGFDMSRLQGVLNAPFADNVRFRIGVDHQERDGYLENVGTGGPDLADVDYTAARASLVWDLTSNLENYTILSYTDSENHGTVGQVFACNTARPVGAICAGVGQNGVPNNFHEVDANQPNPYSNIEQWSLINTTTWALSDNLTIKNIIALQSYELGLQGAVFGSRFQVASGPFTYANAGAHPFGPAIATDGFVEEFQLQGHAFDNRLNWQAGLYYEHTDPDGVYGQQSVASLSCNLNTTGAADPSTWACDDPLNNPLNPAPGNVIRQSGMLEFENRAIYAQGTYDITDRLSLTAGVRYTEDETDADVQQLVWFFDDNPAAGNQHVTNGILGAPTILDCADPSLNPANGDQTSNIQPTAGDCTTSIHQESDAPTWTLGLDYTPMENVLLYAKYSRGYRQGGIVAYATPGLQTYDPEEVDTYEIGAKTSWDGAMPGIFNIALFYNDFRDQQIQAGLLPVTGSGTTAIVNAGSSTIQGLEIEASAELFEGFRLSAGYTYLNTEVEEFAPPTVTTVSTAVPGLNCNPSGLPDFTSPILFCPTYSVAVGQSLPYSPENQFSVTASYTLPTPENFGEVTITANYNFFDEQQAFANQPGQSPFYLLDSYELLNFNINWDRILGSQVDGVVFITNALDEEYVTFISGTWNAGFESRNLGQPMMAGVRLRYNFGG